MSKYSYDPSIPLSVALWLTVDEYDHINEPNYISATGLLRPTRQAILAGRIKDSPFADKSMDLMQRFASRIGTAIHNSLDEAWDTSLERGFNLLGYPDHVAKNTYVYNEKTGLPTVEQIQEHRKNGANIVVKEIRMFREFRGYKIGGKVDFGANGSPEDYKTVKTWAYGDKDKLEKELMQISIYRWLYPELFWTGTGNIVQLFLDWVKGRTSQEGYPPLPIACNTMKLFSEEEVEKYIGDKLAALEKYKDAPETEIPRCTDKELWKGEDKYKYYADPAKAQDPKARSTKNFDNIVDAESHRQSKGKGVIKVVQGEVKACAYCAGYDLCTQKDEYLANGTLSIDSN